MKNRFLQFRKTVKAVMIAHLFGAAGVTNVFAQNITVGELNYSINEDEVSVTVKGHINGISATGNLIIPEIVTYNGDSYAVTKIFSQAFNNCSGLTGSLIIPNTITNIGAYAFKNCTGFNGSLTIGTAVTRIEEEAFANTSFTTVYFNPTNCSKMGYYREDGDWYGSPVFKDCSALTTLNIGENVKQIPTYAFENCSGLTGDLTIPNSVTSIGYGAFYECSGFNGTLTIGTSVSRIGGYAFYHCNGFIGVYYNAINCNNGTEGDQTFTLTNAFFIIGSNVNRIPSCVFGSAGFSGSLTIPNSVKYIGNWAFSGCTNFSGTLTIGTSVQSMGYLAFAGCGFDEIRYNATSCSDITPIYNYLGHRPPFEDCNASIVIGESVMRIPSNMFRAGTFTSVTIHTGTPPSLGEYAFGNTTIPVYVPSCLVEEYQNSSWNSFTNIQGIVTYPFCFNEDGDWSDVANWDGNQLPGVEDGVIISANCEINSNEEVGSLRVLSGKELTIKSNHALTVNGKISNSGGPSALILEDGAQLIHNSINVQATVKKQINGYNGDDGGWYTIATPIAGGITTSDIITGTYDLYYYDEPTHYWKNQKKPENDFTMLNNACGYLYANQDNITLEFSGYLKSCNSIVSVPVSYNGGTLAGFNLVGNPFTDNINIGSVAINGIAQSTYYKAVGGSNLLAYVDADEEPIRPCEGFFVKATEGGFLTFNASNKQTKEKQNEYLRLELNKNDGSTQKSQVDRAYLCMNKGITLEKMSVSNAQSLLYFMNGKEKYAVANAVSENETVPLFLEKANGVFTIKATLLNMECDYLHLIDNLTGNDVDLLQTPSYSFEAKTTDYASRFRLVFRANETDGPSTGSGTENFAYNFNGNWIIANEGEATLQVVDVLGHLLSSETFSGSYEKKLNVAPGVYLLRLVNGDNIKVQKIIVE